MTDKRDKTGVQKTKWAAPVAEAAHQNTQINNIIFQDTMERRMAVELLPGWRTMMDLMGADLCGSNPYQYVRSLRGKGIEINYLKDSGERYGRYKITEPDSRALVSNSLAKTNRNTGGQHG